MRAWLFILICAVPALAAVLEVPQDHSTIQAAFDASADGDTVRVALGTYHEHLIGPAHSISLFSHYPETGDSLDILGTVLDGDLSGTILRVCASPADSLVVNGVTFTRGKGQYQIPIPDAGAIHVLLDANLSVRNCFFTGNVRHLSSQPALISCTSPGWQTQSHVRLENLILVDNLNLNQYTSDAVLMNIVTQGPVFLRGLKVWCTTSAFAGNLRIRSKQEVVLEDVDVTGSNGMEFLVLGLKAMSVKNIRMQDSEMVRFSVQGRALTASRLRFENLSFPGSSGVGVFIDGDSSATIDSLTVTRCRMAGGSHWDNLYQMVVAGCSNDSTHHHSTLRHLVFTDNVIGDTLARPGFNGQTNAISIWGSRLEDAVVARNTMHFWADPLDPNMVFGNAQDGALMYFYTYSGLRDAAIRRCRFEDNLLLDHDSYMMNPWESISVNDGRSLFVNVNRRTDWPVYVDQLEISDLIFRNNRQPNHVPEVLNETVAVGSDFMVYADEMDLLHLHDILMEGIDDGGLFLGSSAINNRVEKMVLKNVKRMGMAPLFSFNSVGEKTIRNVLIDGVVEQDNYLGYPYTWSLQCALVSSSETTASNITVINCNLTNLFYTKDGPTNTIEAFNVYEHFCNPSAVINSDPDFNYCYSATQLTDTGAIQGTDPLFDPALGPPFLAATSPCIDAGNPTATFNDRPDPANPSFARWPSQGGLRNDIGFTGGAAAAVPDTGWVALPRPYEPHRQPRDFSLNAPWPNPFNPVTHISIALTRPEMVKLSVHNLLGQEVAVLVHGLKFAGRHEIEWEAAGLASGMYLLTLEANGRAETRCVTLLR